MMSMLKKLILCMTCTALVYGDSYESIDLEEQKSKSQAKTLHWKAAAFAGTALLAIVTGIVVISLDGGTPNHHHKHHTQDHKPHCRPTDHCERDHHTPHHREHRDPHERTPCMPICPLSPITPPPCVPNNALITQELIL